MRLRLYMLLPLLGLVAGAWAGDFAVRTSVSADKVRVVLDCPAEAPVTALTLPGAGMAQVALPLTEPLPPVPVNDPAVDGITVAPDFFGQAVLTVSLTKARRCDVFTLPADGDKPFRVVVDVLKNFTRRETQSLSPGVVYTRLEKGTDTRYFQAHILDIAATDPHVRLDVAAAQGDRERVSAMVTRTGAVAGVNGGYFTDGTRPVGLLMAGGQVRALPLWARTAAAFPAGGLPVLLNPVGAWRVTLPDGTTRDLPDALDASIKTPMPDTTVYAGNTYQRAPAVPGGQNILVRGGVVAGKCPDPTPLNPGDYVLQARNADCTALDPLLPAGAAVTVAPLTNPDLAPYAAAVGAGPRLLRAGAVTITGAAERFRPDILTGRPARTALGITADGRVLIVAVESPGTYGGGMTLDDLALLLKAEGAVEAMNLDGGGSTAMALGPDTVTAPPNAWIRPVASGVLVFDDRVGTVVAATK
jgi:hypothetical protein